MQKMTDKMVHTGTKQCKCLIQIATKVRKMPREIKQKSVELCYI